MHIEAGVVTGTKMLLSYITSAGVLGITIKLGYDYIKETNFLSFLIKSILATILIFCCFEILPHYPIGISEVHLILGTTTILLFGIAPAAIGLVFGLLIQGIFFAPFDLPQYGINVTTLLASILILNIAIKKIIPPQMAYKDISYTQMLKISIIWEGSIVSWVAFWAFYGQGFGIENLNNIFNFSYAYMGVVLIEPIIDLTVLAAIKIFSNTNCTIFLNKRVHNSNA